MSEEQTKSAEEQLADVVKSTVAEATEGLEALKATVDAFEIPSVEGFVKEETVAELREELKAEREAREELKAVVDNAPAIIKGDKPVEDRFFKWDGELTLTGRGDSSFNKTTVDMTKAFDSTTNVTGAPTASQQVYYRMQQMNPFRGLSTMYPTNSTAVNLPQVTGITAQAEANVPSSIDTSAGHGGGLSNAAVIPQNWVSRTAFSDSSVDDLPSLDMMIGAFMGQQLGIAEATDMITQLDGNTNVAEINTGQGTALPDAIGPWADLVASLSSAYKPNARFVMSREAMRSLRALLQGGTGSDLVIDPSTGDFRLWGYPIVINDHMDAGSVAGQNPVYFGDFSMGTTIISRREMNISRHEETIPGAMYYYGNLRSRGVVWDAAALRRFNVAA